MPLTRTVDKCDHRSEANKNPRLRAKNVSLIKTSPSYISTDDRSIAGKMRRIIKHKQESKAQDIVQRHLLREMFGLTQNVATLC